MEGRNRTIFVVLIAIVIVVAVFSSFGLNLFAPAAPEITLPVVTDPAEDEDSQSGQPADTDRYVRVEVTPETVQNVIRTMVPLQPESYFRTITVETSLGNGAMGTTVNRVWQDAGWTQVESTWPGGTVEYTIAGGGIVYRWYGGDSTWTEWEAGTRDINMAQRIPTYEDVLALNAKLITSAGYEERNGESCVYVETAENELGNRERYWVSVSSGLLIGAETWCGDELVMRMSSEPVEMPVPADTAFTLPDGTVLHAVEG
ncbi:hypothetical protein [uncultured Pseudoflavonifractor sp.]|uniref:hypothetical protein n=1 Tax=uncultured Pseudoflavonifractor sp. TaxID=1221379 RepID=UPI0025F02302|nr:hypothetical protein [uncultured Pseudoflavonifractor sp.]